MSQQGITFEALEGELQGRVASAWANFNGTGTPAIRSSFNLSGIVDNGTGNYSLTHAVNLADADYAAVCSINELGTAVGAQNDGQGAAYSYSVSSTSIVCMNGGGSIRDYQLISVIMFGGV